MSSTSASASAGSSAVVANDRIRALVDSTDATEGTWPADAYEILLLEWAAAVHPQVDEAA
ncbi:hypothetical protein [Streptomyces sp. NPDC088725]|uniref:hypothetical protein n=1 Tax=Streptomyces sp. NPDC088725 TaxID=3365873 RepID=UPI00380B5E81